MIDSEGNKWGATYHYSDGERRVLEGDYITVYGTLKGTSSTRTVLGKQVVLPHISVDRFEW